MIQNGNRQILFTNSQGNWYLYDDDTGFIYPSDGERNLAPYPADLGAAPLGTRMPPPVNVTGASVREHLFGGAYGFRHLILEVTEQCNLRCRYCIYSEHYPLTRGHSNSMMSSETARAATDLYMSNFLIVAERNPDAKPIIGFYGGEPLLNLDVIRDTVRHFEESYPDWTSRVLFSLTTNGMLLNEGAQDFLAQHDFSVIVSIDGDKEHHDRNRVTKSGAGSFDRVFGNIKQFRARHPDHKRLGASVIYDLNSDLTELQRFFDGEKIFVASLSRPAATVTSYYSQFTDVDVHAYNDRVRAFNDQFREAARNGTIDKGSFLFSYAGVSLVEFAFHPIMHEQRPGLVPYTGTCVPGEKLYVLPNGDIHMCERINHRHRIGTVRDGLAFDRIAVIINDYNRSVACACAACNITRFCSRCFATSASEEGFVIPADACEQARRTTVEALVRYVDVAEQCPEILDDVTIEYYRDILDVVGYLGE